MMDFRKLSPQDKRRLLVDLLTRKGLTDVHSLEHLLRLGRQTSGLKDKSQFDPSKEVFLDPDIRPCSPWDETLEPKAIFLTGATGYMGRFLLFELLKSFPSRVYCLIRASSAIDAKKRIEDMMKSSLIWDPDFQHRIVPIPGNLDRPAFGLPPEKFDFLAREIDWIYHAGATVNFVYPYSALKAPNVDATREIIRLACQYRTKRLHYVSSMAVFDSLGYSGKPALEDLALQHGDSLFIGYVQTKWASDSIISLAGTRGVPISIHRPPFISCHSETGVCNTKDFVARWISGITQLGCVSNINIRMDLVPVDYLCKAIIHLSRSRTSIGKAFHYFLPQPFLSHQLVEWLTGYGYKLSVAPYDEWESGLLRTAALGVDNALHPLLGFLAARVGEENGRPLSIADMYSSERRPRYDGKNVQFELQNASIPCPSSEQLFRTYYDYLIRSGFLKPPGGAAGNPSRAHARPSF
ncbi:MAG: thioester reductase domain-containing protein [Elusimicrobia bacterium]|nr:thioester reductase domain-containing protein [Elusimicrobiota bacterium]